MPDSPPVQADPALIGRLRDDLAAADYTSERIEDLLGPMASAALRREQSIPARRVLAGLDDPAAILFGLLTLGIDVTPETADAVLPSLRADGAIQLGILAPVDESEQPVEEGARPVGDGQHPIEESARPMLRAAIDLHPYSAEDDAGPIRWWIASDRSEAATGAPLGPDHVLGVGGASLTLATITPRRQVDRTLDLGCGCGIQAMHAARHSTSVVATDLSERALAFAAFNAALNGLELDLRPGSLLEPVAGERFDLIVSNPPFVITPRDGRVETWTYRDGGAVGDTLIGRLIAQLPAHLEPGGRAVMLGNWEIAGDDWTLGPRRWLDAAAADGIGLDAWIIQRAREDPAEYAHTWARDGGITESDPRYAAMVDAWLDDFASRGTEAIGFGYLLLQRPGPVGADAGAADATAAGQTGRATTAALGADANAAGPGTSAASRDSFAVFEELPGRGTGSLAAHLADALDARTALANLDDDALLALHAVRADDVVERRHLTPGEWDPMLIELVQGAGFGRAVPADTMLAAVVGASDGDLSLRQIIGAVCALTAADPEQETDRLAPLLRDLIGAGMLRLGPPPSAPGAGDVPSGTPGAAR